ncbi:hypothetical protein [Peribacillus sp. NPDC056705]|uniref:hypothetical protein n=1 Tax=Peribacillus sp. NPDC056705 TaxID=3345918 RepID=UPI003748A906
MNQPMPLLTYDLFTVYARQGTRLEYGRVYFERRRRLNTFTLLTLLEPDAGTYRQARDEMLWAICDEFTWCLPAHLGTESAAEIRGTIDLFSAETGFALSEIRVLLGGDLPPLLVSRIHEEVSRRLFDPYLRHTFGWETATHNWSAVCAGSIGAAALLLLDDRDRLKEILLKSQQSMDYYLQGFGSDGACLEGLGYWNYGFGYFVYYADLLKQRRNGEIDWFGEEKVGRIAAFQQSCYLGGKHVANFSDSSPEGSLHIGLSHRLAARYEDIDVPLEQLRAPYVEDHCSRWAPALRNWIWRDPGQQGQDWAEADYYLPDAQWIISRVQHEDRGYAFAAKGGHNAEPHNHNDLGHFILYGAGAIWCADLGCGEYTADYFGEGRYGYDCNGSQGHSVPIIDGHYQEAGGSSRAVVLDAVTGEKQVMLKLDLTSAYRVPLLRKYTREFQWNKQGARPELRIKDRFEFSEPPGCLTERIVTRWRPERCLVDGVNLVKLGGGLVIHYDGAQVDADLQEHWFRDHHGVNVAWYSVDLHMKQPGLDVSMDMRFEYASLKGVEEK